jgi:hypothetical protein
MTETKILKTNSKYDRYLKVCLYKNNIGKYRTIHRLVAEAFIENNNNYKIINHIDGNRLNNRVDNLEWCTQKHNVKEAWKNGLSKPNFLNKNHSEQTKEIIKNKLKGRMSNRASFSKDEAKDIIQRKNNGEKRRDVYAIYKNKISKLGFENIWYKKSYKNIWEEINNG